MTDWQQNAADAQMAQMTNLTQDTGPLTQALAREVRPADRWRD